LRQLPGALPLPALDLERPDERPRSLVGLQAPAQFQLAIGADHGVRIDRQIHRQLSHRRKLVPGLQSAGSDSAAHLVDDLPVDGHPAMPFQPDPESCRALFHFD
jgi:hypothetical protein